MYKWIFQHLVWPVWEWRNHFSIREQIEDLRFLEKLTREEIVWNKEQQLWLLLKHAYCNVPFYREVFEDVGFTDFEEFTLGDLHNLPVVTPEDLQAICSAAMTALNAEDWKWQWQASSGSTGKPKRYKINNSAISWAYASLYRFWGWHGWRLGDKFGHMKSDTMQISLQKKLKSLVYRQLWMPARMLTDELIREYLTEIKKAHLKMLRLNPSTAYALASYALEHELKDLQLPVIHTHGATLYPEWRKIIEAVFQCPVVDGYGAEGMNIAHQCEETDMYHISENVIVEEDGGDLILTNLVNFVQPFIRYRIEDLGVLSNRKCPCGREHTLLKTLYGRATDFCLLPNGTKLSPHFWTHHLTPIPWIQQWQVVQPDLTHLELRIVRKELPAHLIEQIKKDFREYLLLKLTKNVDLAVEFVEEIPLPKSGKHRHVICEV